MGYALEKKAISYELKTPVLTLTRDLYDKLCDIFMRAFTDLYEHLADMPAQEVGEPCRLKVETDKGHFVEFEIRVAEETQR